MKTTEENVNPDTPPARGKTTLEKFHPPTNHQEVPASTYFKQGPACSTIAIFKIFLY
jgi:hypothetical protein